MKKEILNQIKKLDPRNIDVEWVDATRVIFETPKGDYVFTKPKVVEMKVTGTIAYIVSSGVKPEFIVKKEEKKEEQKGVKE